MDWNYSECHGDSDADEPNATNEQQTEVLQVLRQTLELPKDLCAQPEIFWEFFSLQHLWNEMPKDTREELMSKFLPQFPVDACEDVAREKELSVEKMFEREPFRFDSSPLVDFQRNLEDGQYLLDVVKYKKKIAKGERHERRYQQCEYMSRLAVKLAESRRQLLARGAQGFASYVEPCSRTFSDTVATRARKRYLTEIAGIMSEANLPLSDSEQEEDMFASMGNKRIPRKISKPTVAGTNLVSDVLWTEKAGVSKIYGTFSGKQKMGSSLPVSSVSSDLFDEEYLQQTLRKHSKRKTDHHPAYRSSFHEHLLQDLFNIEDVPPKKRKKSEKSRQNNSQLKTESIKKEASHLVHQEPFKSRLDGSSRTCTGQPLAKKMKTALESRTITSSSPSETNSALLIAVQQQTHACFMSLVRSIFCSTPDHRITFDNLQRTVRGWLTQDRGSSTWYDGCHNWLEELPSVVKFLVGEFVEQPEDYVPYIEYKAPLKIYQWIGAGRDTDQHLLPLNRFWLEHRHDIGRSKGVNKSTSSATVVSGSPEVVVEPEMIPPPRFPTSWVIRPERSDEVAAFRQQEKERYENPMQPFTYRLHGYESVVGPVSGVFAQVLNKGLNLLTPDRPPCVTWISLVRDAAARLPNGEGTRAHICELLKASQFVIPGSVLHVVVNAVIERLQKEAEKSVWIDPRRKNVVYAHRGKTEADFKRQQSTLVPRIVPNRTINHVILGKGVNSGQNRQSLQGNMTTTSLMRSSQVPVTQNSVFQIRPTKSAITAAKPTVIASRTTSPGNRITIAQSQRTSVGSTKDVEANMDAKHPPALIPNLTYTTNKSTAIKVSTNQGAQSLSVAGSGTTSSPGQNQQRSVVSVLATPQGQPMLLQNQRTIKMSPTGNAQPFLLSSVVSSSPPALVPTSRSSPGFNNKTPVTSRASPVAVLPTSTKVIRARHSGSPVVAGQVTVVPKKTITVSPTAIAAAVKANAAAQKPIQICTSTGNVTVVEKLSPANGGANVLRTAATNLMAGHKPVIQNIVIRSGSPQQKGRTAVPLKTFSTNADGGQSVKSIIVTNSVATGEDTGRSPVGSSNVIKIRTSAANQLLANNSQTTTKTITTASGAQYLQIHSAGGGQPQQFFLNSVRTASSNSQQGGLSNAVAVKATTLTGVKQSTGQLVQLPPKTLIKGATPMTARVIKAVPNSSQGTSGVTATGQTIVRAVQSRMVSATGAHGQLVTLVDGQGKATNSTPIRIGKSGNVIQLTATNGTAGAGNGTQYTVLSPGRSVIQVQQQPSQPKRTADGQSTGGNVTVQQSRTQIVSAKVLGSGDGAAKPAIRMVNAANIARLGTGKPVLISNKMPGTMTNLVRAATGTGTKISPVTSGTSGGVATSTSLVIGGQTVKVPSSINLNSGNATIVGRASQGATTAQHVMIGNQLVKIQSAGNAATGDRGKSVILNNIGQTYKVQSVVQSQGKLIKTTVPMVKGVGNLKPITSTSGTPNRVVLVQGPQGQLLLPTNLQGGTAGPNYVKSLKMISVQPQAQQQSSQNN